MALSVTCGVSESSCKPRCTLGVARSDWCAACLLTMGERGCARCCDLYSRYILLCGYPPFWGDRDQEIFRKVRRGHVSFDGPEWDAVSDNAKDLIMNLLNMNPRQRWVHATRVCVPSCWFGGACVFVCVQLTASSAPCPTHTHRISAGAALQHAWMLSDGGNQMHVISTSMLRT